MLQKHLGGDNGRVVKSQVLIQHRDNSLCSSEP